MSRDRKIWLAGYYKPVMEDFATWAEEWSLGPHADFGDVWFKGGYYSEQQARRILLAAENVFRERSEPE